MVSVTLSLKEDLYDRLREYCKRHGIRTSDVIEELIKLALPILEEREKNVQAVHNR